MYNNSNGSKLNENIKPQVPGITTQKEKNEKTTELKNEELFYRANMYRGS